MGRLAPLAVDERYRDRALAQLVYEGLDSLNEFGYAAVVTLGDQIYAVASALNRSALDLRSAGRTARGVPGSPSGG